MDECFKCGVSEQNAKLHNAISEKGIVRVCERCSLDGDFPVLRKTEASLEKADKTAPIGGLMREREKAFEHMRAGRRSPVMGKQDVTLRDLVEKNYKEQVDMEKKSWPGVIRNFNWIIMRARRNKGFGQKSLAESIGEPEIAIRMAERGVLPKEYVPFLRKLEKVLDVNLMDEHPFRLEEHKKMLDFKNAPSNRMTIADLRSMAKKKEIEIIKSKELLEKEQAAKEAQELLDETDEGQEKRAFSDGQSKESSLGFFGRLFSKKEKSTEVEDSESSADEQGKDILKSTASTRVQNKDTAKSDSISPGRTKPVPKYRWQH